MSALRVLHYHPDIRLEKGGVVRFVLDLAGACAGAGMDVTVCSPDLTDAPDDWGRPGTPRPAPFPSMGGPNRFFRHEGIAAARSLLREHDVLHLHGAWLFSNPQFAREARRAGVPYIASPHGMLDDWSMAQSALRKRVFYGVWGRAYWARAAAVLCTARGELEQSRKWFPRSRGVVLPPVVDMAPYRTLPGPDAARAKFPPPLAGAPVVLFLSRVHEKKRPEVLIDMAAALRSRGTHVNVLIAGTGEKGYEESLRRRIAERGVEDRVRLLGLVTGALKTSLYQMADVFALPTSQENFGLVLTEAMACATPAITTRGVDIWPELESSGGALLAEPTPEGFGEAVAGLLADPARLARMGGTARSWVLEYLDPSLVVGKYAELYRSAANPAPPGGRS